MEDALIYDGDKFSRIINLLDEYPQLFIESPINVITKLIKDNFENVYTQVNDSRCKKYLCVTHWKCNNGHENHGFKLYFEIIGENCKMIEESNVTEKGIIRIDDFRYEYASANYNRRVRYDSIQPENIIINMNNIVNFINEWLANGKCENINNKWVHELWLNRYQLKSARKI